MVLSLACELQTRGSTLMTNIIRLLTAGAAALIASAACALGANFSFTGNFTGDDQVLLFGFTVTAPVTVTLKTLGYAGGTNAAGAVIPAGGFDPVLSLFRSDGSFFSLNDDDISTGSFDALLQSSLLAGSYTLALTQTFSFPKGSLAQGFSSSEAKDFRTRKSLYAVDILGVTTASLLQPSPSGVPDAVSTLALLVLSLGGLVGLRRFVNSA